jgi:hypothetical protein
VDSNEEDVYEDTLNLANYVQSKITSFLKGKEGSNPIVILDDLFTLGVIAKERNTVTIFEFLQALRILQQEHKFELHIFSPIMTNSINPEFEIISNFIFKHASAHI